MGKPKYWVKSDKCMGVSQLLGARACAAPLILVRLHKTPNNWNRLRSQSSSKASIVCIERPPWVRQSHSEDDVISHHSQSSTNEEPSLNHTAYHFHPIMEYFS